MPDLFHTLHSTDFDFLQRLARAWKVDLPSQDFNSALEEILRSFTTEELLNEVIERLPARAGQAWKYLLEHKGRESWSIFTRHFGELRAFGVARRSREEPDLHPFSAVEELWYRGLIGRAFLDIPPEPQEYVYIPDEWMAFVTPQVREEPLHLRPASSSEKKIITPANDTILDEATEYLAALRMGRPAGGALSIHSQAYLKFISTLLLEAGILVDPANPDAGKVKDFLAAPRGKALFLLFQTWQKSKRINDLRMLPELLFEGNWSNDPFAPRELIARTIAPLDTKTWYSLNGLISQVKENQPDFQRPAGDYDSWFIRDAATNEHLHGASHWDEIEGALLYYLFSGPLYWLGVVDLAQSAKDGPFTAFKLSLSGHDLFAGCASGHCKEETGQVAVNSDGIVHIPNHVPRATRYQISRFGSPLSVTPSERKYRLTPASLQQAAEQGLKISHLQQVFQQAGVKKPPPNLLQQLERWEKYGSEASVEKAILLHLNRPELLPLLQKNQRVSQSIATVLNAQTAIVRPGKVEQLRQGLAELGLLAEIKIDMDV
jgi:hypothetical protein